MKFVESSNVIICACIKTFCVVYKRGANSSPFPLEMSKISLHWKIWDFNGHFVDPLRAKASTSMFSNGGRTNLLHSAYKAFTHCCAFEHTTILVRPLPSCQYILNGITFYPCCMKCRCYKTHIPPYMACLVASNTMDPTHFVFSP